MCIPSIPVTGSVSDLDNTTFSVVITKKLWGLYGPFNTATQAFFSGDVSDETFQMLRNEFIPLNISILFTTLFQRDKNRQFCNGACLFLRVILKWLQWRCDILWTSCQITWLPFSTFVGSAASMAHSNSFNDTAAFSILQAASVFSFPGLSCPWNVFMSFVRAVDTFTCNPSRVIFLVRRGQSGQSSPYSWYGFF